MACQRGTLLVRDINPLPGSSPANLVDVNNTLFFAADDGVNGKELWKSNGTLGGTTLVKDIRTRNGSASPHAMGNINGKLFFFANDGASGDELWRSDGTSPGTSLVKDINPGITGSYAIDQMVNMNGWAYFAANDGVHGVELWRSDGTAANTVLFMDINPSGNSTPVALTVVDGALYFLAQQMGSSSV